MRSNKDQGCKMIRRGSPKKGASDDRKRGRTKKRKRKHSKKRRRYSSTSSSSVSENNSLETKKKPRKNAIKKRKKHRSKKSSSSLNESDTESILLLGEQTNLMTYIRRFNILSALNCAPQQSKEMLREKVDIFQQQDKNLFGKKFRKNLGSTLFCQPNQRSKPSDCFVTRVRKALFIWPIRDIKDKLWKAANILPQKE